jgi:hypothetical protein
MRSSEGDHPSRSALRWIAFAPTPICGGGHKVDAALGIGAAVDADLQASQCQVLVLQIEPAIALLQKLLLLAGPEPILDLARLAAQRTAPSSPVTAIFFAPNPASVSGLSVVIRWTCGLPGSS